MLLAFSEDRPRASIRELASEIGVPLSTAYRYVSLLREVGLLEEASTGSYQVGARIQALARASERVDTLAQLARPAMEELTATLGETTMLVRVIGGAAVCVARVESARAVRLSVQTGQPLPFYTGASGKALLAAMPVARRERLLALNAAWDPQVASSLLDPEDELARIAERGWAESHGEIDEGIWACAAILAPPGEAVAALTVAGPAYRISEDARRRIREQLCATSRRLEG